MMQHQITSIHTFPRIQYSDRCYVVTTNRQLPVVAMLNHYRVIDLALLTSSRPFVISSIQSSVATDTTIFWAGNTCVRVTHSTGLGLTAMLLLMFIIFVSVVLSEIKDCASLVQSFVKKEINNSIEGFNDDYVIRPQVSFAVSSRAGHWITGIPNCFLGFSTDKRSSLARSGSSDF